MIFTMFITMAILCFAVLTAVVLYYLPLMSRDTRKLWLINLSLLGLRQVFALIQPLITKLFPSEYITDIFRLINYSISILISVWFIIYIHKRYKKEYYEKYENNKLDS